MGPSSAVVIITFQHDQHLLPRVSKHFALWNMMPFNSSDSSLLIKAFIFVSFSNSGSWEQWHLLVNPVNWIFASPTSSKSQRQFFSVVKMQIVSAVLLLFCLHKVSTILYIYTYMKTVCNYVQTLSKCTVKNTITYRIFQSFWWMNRLSIVFFMSFVFAFPGRK